MALFDQEKFNEAEPHFAEAAKVQDFAHADFALLRQAQCRLEAGKTTEAVPLFVELPNKYPNSAYKAVALLAAGKCSYLTDKLDEARTLLEPLANSENQEAAEAAYWLGRTLLKQDKPADALTVLEKAVGRVKEGEFAPYLQVARIDAMYELPDRRGETAGLYRQFVQQYPDHPLAPQATYMTALAALGAEDYAASRQFAESFLSNPANADHELTPTVLYIAAEACLLPTETNPQSGDAVRAEQLYRQLVEKYPDHVRAARSNLRIGWCLYQANKSAEAVTHLTGALGQMKDASHVAEAQLLIGRSYAAGEAGNHQQAIQAYDAALAAKPDWARADEVLLAAAQSLQKLNDADGAAQRLSKLLDSYPNSEFRGQALYQLGEIAQEQSQEDQAIARFQEVVAKHADSQFAAAAQYGLASAHFAKGQYDEARKALDALLAGTPDPQIAVRGHHLRGLVLQRKSEFEPAVKDLEEFLKSNPEEEARLHARYAVALCRIGSKQFDQAASQLSGILSDKPDWELADRVHYELGHVLASLGKAEDSAKAFRALAEGFPDSPLAAESWFHVGTSHEKQAEGAEAEDAKSQQLDQAADAFSKGLAKAHDVKLKEKLQYKLGDMRFRQGNYAEAAKVLVAQINEHPQGELAGPARYLAAESLMRQEDYQQALPLFEKVSADKVEPYLAVSLFGAGKCAKALENWSAAETHFSALVSQFPDFPQIHEARYGYALALHKQDKVSEAAAIYDQITKATETETAARARFMIGEIAFAQKKHAEAIEHYLEVAFGYPYKELQGLAQYETGRCFVELGEKEKAIAAFQAVLDNYPEHPQVENAKRLIVELQK
jgi:TolA-binding protein